MVSGGRDARRGAEISDSHAGLEPPLGLTVYLGVEPNPTRLVRQIRLDATGIGPGIRVPPRPVGADLLVKLGHLLSRRGGAARAQHHGSERREVQKPRDLPPLRSGGSRPTAAPTGQEFLVGAGYDTGRFSGDLTDLTLEAQGLFLNVVAKF